jgi:hypothetical protein
VHPEMPRRKVGERLSVRDPECNVVERLRLHSGEPSCPTTSYVGYFRRSTARCNCALLMRERPGMFRRFASL